MRIYEKIIVVYCQNQLKLCARNILILNQTAFTAEYFAHSSVRMRAVDNEKRYFICKSYIYYLSVCMFKISTRLAQQMQEFFTRTENSKTGNESTPPPQKKNLEIVGLFKDLSMEFNEVLFIIIFPEN